jgi:hypothetical protein
MAVHSRRIRRARARTMPTYMVVAHAMDLVDVEHTLEAMPLCAHGVLFVVSDDLQVAQVKVPPRFSVTVLPSYSALERAADAWLTEMTDEDARLCAWFTNSVRELGKRVCRRFELPAHFGRAF